MADFDAIIKAVKESELIELLKYLVAKGVVDYSKKGYEKLKKIIIDKYNEKKYAFVPNKEEANKLLKAAGSAIYKQVEMLVPRYRYIDLIRTGLLIKDYHEQNTAAATSRIIEIKKNINRRPNGHHFIKIVNLPATPFFTLILQYLLELKSSGYSEHQLEEKFEELVNEWEQSSKFFKVENKIEDVISFCQTQANINRKSFFILGMKSVSDMIESAIDKLTQENFFKNNEYIPKIVKITEGSQPRIEVTVSKIES